MQSAIAEPLFRPPAPPRLREPLGTFEFLRLVRANPLATWADEHFEEPIVAGEGVLGRITVVSDPATSSSTTPPTTARTSCKSGSSPRVSARGF